MKLRVLFVTSCYFADYTLHLAAELAHDALVFVEADEDTERHCSKSLWQIANSSVNLVARKARRKHQKVFRAFAIATRALILRPHIIHMQEHPEIDSYLVSFLLHRLFPIVLTVHDPLAHSGADAAYRQRSLRTVLSLRRHAKILMVNGEFCRQQLCSVPEAQGKEIAVTTHGVVAEGTVMPPLVEHRRFLLIGRMEAYKGIEDLLDAAQLLAARGLTLQLRLVGRGSELDRLRNRLQEPWISVREGFLAPQDFAAEISASSAVVLPYRDATQSGVVAAAFGNGRTVIATNVGGIPEVVINGVNGLLVPPNDVDSLADAMASLVKSDDLLLELTNGAMTTSQTVMSWTSIARTILDLYQRVALGPRGTT